jgi:CRP/FNR family cyclic AMP-dependent transcriptional regulator
VRVGAAYPGETVGSTNVLLPGPRQTSISADVLTSVTLLRRTALLELENEHPEIMLNLRRGVLRELVRRLREADARIDGELGRRDDTDAGLESPGEPAPLSRTPLKLTAVPAFATFEPAELKALVANATPRSYKPGDVLVREGERSDACHIVLRGTVDLQRGRGQRSHVARLSDGAFVGQQALVDDTPRTATAVVVQRSAIMTVEREVFEFALERGAPYALRFLEQLSTTGIRQYRRATRRLLHLLGGDPKWAEADTKRPGDWREETREAAGEAIAQATTTKQVNTAMLQHLRVATNEWGLDLDFSKSS